MARAIVTLAPDNVTLARVIVTLAPAIGTLTQSITTLLRGHRNVDEGPSHRCGRVITTVRRCRRIVVERQPERRGVASATLSTASVTSWTTKVTVDDDERNADEERTGMSMAGTRRSPSCPVQPRHRLSISASNSDISLVDSLTCVKSARLECDAPDARSVPKPLETSSFRSEVRLRAGHGGTSSEDYKSF